jgi:hypothetical protein
MSLHAAICAINYLNNLIKLRSDLRSSRILRSAEWFHDNISFQTSTVRLPKKFLLGHLDPFLAVNIPEERRSHTQQQQQQ